MSIALPAWHPATHPIHKLVQLLDVCAAALNRYQQRMYELPMPTKPAEWDQWIKDTADIRNEYTRVVLATFPPRDIGPRRTAERLAISCVAWLASKSLAQEEGTILAACDTLALFWQPGFPERITYDAGSEAARRFEWHNELIQAYLNGRPQLLLVLARATETVPEDVHNRELLSVAVAGGVGNAPPSTDSLLALVAETKTPIVAAVIPKPETKPKRSTEQGEGRAKLIAELTRYHRYADGGSLNLEPINNNELVRQAGVDKATATAKRTAARCRRASSARRPSTSASATRGKCWKTRCD